MARSCTNAVRKRAAFTDPRASAEPGTKRGRLAGGMSYTERTMTGRTALTPIHVSISSAVRRMTGIAFG